jgi:hypothetical protein
MAPLQLSLAMGVKQLITADHPAALAALLEVNVKVKQPFTDTKLCAAELHSTHWYSKGADVLAPL